MEKRKAPHYHSTANRQTALQHKSLDFTSQKSIQEGLQPISITLALSLGIKR